MELILFNFFNRIFFDDKGRFVGYEVNGKWTFPNHLSNYDNFTQQLTPAIYVGAFTQLVFKLNGDGFSGTVPNIYFDATFGLNKTLIFTKSTIDNSIVLQGNDIIVRILPGDFLTFQDCRIKFYLRTEDGTPLAGGILTIDKF